MGEAVGPVAEHGGIDGVRGSSSGERWAGQIRCSSSACSRHGTVAQQIGDLPSGRRALRTVQDVEQLRDGHLSLLPVTESGEIGEPTDQPLNSCRERTRTFIEQSPRRHPRPSADV